MFCVNYQDQKLWCIKPPPFLQSECWVERLFLSVILYSSSRWCDFIMVPSSGLFVLNDTILFCVLEWEWVMVFKWVGVWGIFFLCDCYFWYFCMEQRVCDRGFFFFPWDFTMVYSMPSLPSVVLLFASVFSFLVSLVLNCLFLIFCVCVFQLLLYPLHIL